MSNTNQPVNITSPVGRIVQGSLYKANDKDAEGRPLVIKNGPNAGKPTVNYYFALAIPKGTETHWALTPWGKEIWAVGHAAFPGVAQRQDFAWKITDGDSTIPNKKGRKPCDQEGFKGHWVLRFTSGFAVRCFNANGSQALADDAVKCGYYVQVAFSVVGNDSPNQPGVFLNPQMVALAGFGPEIFSGPDPLSAHFGEGVTLPPGASAVPIGALPGAPASPAAPPPPGAPASAPPPAVAVQPHAAILTPPVPGAPTAAPPPPGAPSAPSAKQMTAKAAGKPYADFIAAGWNDAQLVQHGYMTP